MANVQPRSERRIPLMRRAAIASCTVPQMLRSLAADDDCTDQSHGYHQNDPGHEYPSGPGRPTRRAQEIDRAGGDAGVWQIHRVPLFSCWLPGFSLAENIDAITASPHSDTPGATP